MSWWEAIILGIVQGLTEFLPVSSSGHLALFGNWFNIEESQAMFFFVMLHVATLVAVVLVLWKNIKQLIKWPIKREVWLLVIATIPAGIAGVLLSDFIEKLFGGNWLWLCFALTAAILLATELILKHREKQAKTVSETALNEVKKTSETALNEIKKTSETADIVTAEKAGEVKEEKTAADSVAADKADKSAITLKQAIGMGCAQAVAIIPGISRSGSTIAAGLLLGADKKKLSSFSFLMSIPIILASALLEFLKIESFSQDNFFYVALGMCAAFVSGYFSVTFMLKIIAKSNYKWFSLYLILLSILTLILQLTA